MYYDVQRVNLRKFVRFGYRSERVGPAKTINTNFLCFTRNHNFPENSRVHRRFTQWRYIFYVRIGRGHVHATRIHSEYVQKRIPSNSPKSFVDVRRRNGRQAKQRDDGQLVSTTRRPW